MSLNVSKPRPVHLRSARGNHAVCGSGGPFSLRPPARTASRSTGRPSASTGRRGADR
jgi:hypothetical protein